VPEPHDGDRRERARRATLADDPFLAVAHLTLERRIKADAGPDAGCRPQRRRDGHAEVPAAPPEEINGVGDAVGGLVALPEFGSIEPPRRPAGERRIETVTTSRPGARHEHDGRRRERQPDRALQLELQVVDHR
jgi:hypothetical protein